MSQTIFTWVPTHKALTNYLSQKENSQAELLALLESVGIGPLNDMAEKGSHNIRLTEIDPFTFYCYIYKYGPEKRLALLKAIAEKLNLPIPTDESGIPSAQAQKVWLFPYKYQRVNNEMNRLWKFFHKAISKNITDADFADVLEIHNTGKSKITEALFYIMPNEYLPINGPTKAYLDEVLHVNTKFETFAEYQVILKTVKQKSLLPFYELSYEAWKWSREQKNQNFWIFQGNPKFYDIETALRNNLLNAWTVTAHKEKIKVGDKVIVWMTGNKAGCYALAEVISNPQKIEDLTDAHLFSGNDPNSLKAGIRVTHNLIDNPILEKEIKAEQLLDDLKTGNQGTNFMANEKQFSTLLNMAKNRTEKRYWIYAPGENAHMWDAFYTEGIMGLGWDKIGDLNQYKTREEIKAAITSAYGGKGSKMNDVLANEDFHHRVKIGDVIIAKKGRNELLGYGVVDSDYFYDAMRSSFQKCRKVSWKLKGSWKVDFNLVLKTLTDITQYATEDKNYNTYYERLLGIMQANGTMPSPTPIKYPLNSIFYGPPGTGKTYNTVRRAAELIEERIIEDYSEALQVFNKHLHTRIEFITFHQNYSYEDFIQGLRPDTNSGGQLSFEKRDGIFKVIADRALKNVVESRKAPAERSLEIKFDAALELFIDALSENDGIFQITENCQVYEVEDDAFRYKGDNWNRHSGGIRMKFSDLKEFYLQDVKNRRQIKDLQNISALAKQHATYYFGVYEAIRKYVTKSNPEAIPSQTIQNYVLIIDEINRANISRVFGELITLIEPDKRDGGKTAMKVSLPSGDSFTVPGNLYIIGTMNTADKSIALLDIALRRRFEFEPMYPKYDLPHATVYDADVLKKINARIIQTKGHDFQIGHAYFMGEDETLVQRMNGKVIPLLLEYYMNDTNEVKNILRSADLIINDEAWPLQITGRNASAV